MKLLSLNMRVWTRDKDKSSTHYWRSRMERIKNIINLEEPDVLCLQECSFPMQLWIPWRYRKVGFSASHHIYVRKGVKASPVGWNIFHNEAMVDGVLISNVHGTWKSKWMNKVWPKLNRIHHSQGPSLIVGDFNQSEPAVNQWLGYTVRQDLDKELIDTFYHYTKDQHYTPDHAVSNNLAIKSFYVIDTGFNLSDHEPLLLEW